MKKSRLLLFLLLAFIVVPFLIQFVSAQASPLQDLKSLFSGFGSGSTFFEGPLFAKFLLFVLVALVVYAISDALPFMEGQKKSFVNIGIAVVISILSVMYLKSEEIYTILLSYSALGIFITLVIPFFVIAAIQVKAYERSQHWMTRQLWLFYILILVVKWYGARNIPAGEAGSIGSFGLLLYPLAALLALFMYFFEGNLIGRWLRMKTKEGIRAFARRGAKVNAVESVRAAAVDSASRGEGRNRGAFGVETEE